MDYNSGSNRTSNFTYSKTTPELHDMKSDYQLFVSITKVKDTKIERNPFIKKRQVIILSVLQHNTKAEIIQLQVSNLKFILDTYNWIPTIGHLLDLAITA